MLPSVPDRRFVTEFAGGASRLAALLLSHISPICSVVAPCQPGAARRDSGNESPIRDTRSLRRIGLGAAVALLTVVSTQLPEQFAQAQSADYLPLAVGNRWELVSTATPTPMVFEVTRRDGNAYVVRWDNPWVKAEFRFVKQGDRVLLDALDMGAGSGPMPENTVYFDFGARSGARWSNALGTLQVASKDRRITTSGRTYDRAIEIRARDRQGATTIWTFAPNVGFVQFGEGRDAFKLASFRAGGGDGGRTTNTPPSRAPSRAPARGGDRVLIGMDFNPPANEGFEEPAKRNAFRRTVNAGVSIIKVTPTWVDLEPRPGSYNFRDVDFHVELAEQYNLPMHLNLRVIDTSRKSVPSAYERYAFDDRRLVEPLERLIRALGARMKGRVRWVAIGNEVDSYLKSRSGDVAAYARMMERIDGVIQESFPGAAITVNFTRDAAGDLAGKYKAITAPLQLYSFTYYPLNISFTMRDPSSASGDIRKMLDAAGDRPIILQEIGYASAERLNSSEEKQAQFYRNVFTELRNNRSRIIAGFFLFMSDLPENTVEEFLKYYRLPLFRDNFRAYLSTLGLFDRNGEPKPAWDVFQDGARELSGNDGRR